MNLTRLAVAGARWTTVSAIVGVIAHLLQLTVLAHLLTPRDFGLVGIVMLVIGFAQAFTDLGISAALIHRQDATPDQLSSLYWLNVLAGIVVLAVVLALAPLVGDAFGDAALVPVLRAVSLVFVVVPLGKQFEMLLQRDLRFATLARQEVTAAVVSTAAVIGIALSGGGVWALVAGTIAGAVTRTTQLVAWGVRFHKPALRFRRADLDGYVSFGLYQIGERCISYVGSRLDQLLIGGMLGASALGYYNFAYNLAMQPVTRVNPILTRVAFPTLSKVQHDRARLQRGYLKVLRLLTLTNAPLLVGFAVVAPRLIPLVFGDQWIPSVILVQLLSFVALLRAVANPVGSLLLARGRADLGFRWNVLVLAVFVPTVLIGGRIGGAAGIAGALLAMQVLLTVGTYWILVRPAAGACGEAYTAAILRPLVYAGIMAAAILPLEGLSEVLPAVPYLALQVLLGGAAYLLLIWSFERRLLEELRPSAVAGS